MTAISAADRRKEYVITERGRRVFEIELTRLEELLAHGKLVRGGN